MLSNDIAELPALVRAGFAAPETRYLLQKRRAGLPLSSAETDALRQLDEIAEVIRKVHAYIEAGMAGNEKTAPVVGEPGAVTGGHAHALDP